MQQLWLRVGLAVPLMVWILLQVWMWLWRKRVWDEAGMIMPVLVLEALLMSVKLTGEGGLSWDTLAASKEEGARS